MSDIYGVRSGTIALDTGNYDNTGDDAVLSSWFWFNFATVTVQSGYVPMDTLEKISGATVTDDAALTPDATTYSQDLWNEDALNQKPLPMLIRVPGKDRLGGLRVIDFVLYRVQFGPFSFDGPSYKSGLLTNYTGRAVMSLYDEAGAALPGGKKSIGRLINKPG